MIIKSGYIFEIATDPEFEVMETSPDLLAPVKHPLPIEGIWEFPPASVSAVELQIAKRVEGEEV